MPIRFLPAALIAVLIALVAAGGAALAFSFGGERSERTDDLLDRAAAELGVEPQTLKDALSQARLEITTEKRQALLAKLVEAQVITQEQADETSAWLDAMPEAAAGLLETGSLSRIVTRIGVDVVIGSAARSRVRAPELGAEVTGKMAEILGIDPVDLKDALGRARDGQATDDRSAAIDELISDLVADGVLTEAEGEDVKAWLAEMPEWLAEPGMLMRIFGHKIAGMDFEFSGASVFPFDKELRLEVIPKLEELRGRSEPFFFTPDTPGQPGDGRRFFYHGPEGEFEFEGDLPEELQEMLERLDRRFDGRFRFDGLDDLFKRLPQYETPVPDGDSEDGTADTASAVKGA